jgi:hypothetical protein
VTENQDGSYVAFVKEALKIIGADNGNEEPAREVALVAAFRKHFGQEPFGAQVMLMSEFLESNADANYLHTGYLVVQGVLKPFVDQMVSPPSAEDAAKVLAVYDKFGEPLTMPADEGLIVEGSEVLDKFLAQIFAKLLPGESAKLYWKFFLTALKQGRKPDFWLQAALAPYLGIQYARFFVMMAIEAHEDHRDDAAWWQDVGNAAYQEAGLVMEEQPVPID